MKNVVLLGALIAAAGACGDLEAPQRRGPTLRPDDVTPDATNTNTNSDVTPSRAPDAPVLDPLPASTGYLTVPLQGTVEASATVVVTGGAGPVFVDADTAGRFCLDVQLARDALNTLEVLAQNREGQASDPVTVSVLQNPALHGDESAEEATEAPGQVQNVVSVNACEVYADQLPSQGALLDILDNDGSSVLVIEAGELWIDLGALYDLEAVEIQWRDTPASSDKHYGVVYSLATSASAHDSVPSAWSLAASVDGASGGVGDGGGDRFEFEEPQTARWISLDLARNGASDWFNEPFAIADVLAFSFVPDRSEPVVQPGAPTCLAP